MRILLPAQDTENPLAKVSQGFREYSQGQGSMAIVIAGVFLVLILALLFFGLVSTRRKSARWRTFREFAEASGLTPAETKSLIFVAERTQPDNPLALFVKRSVFEGSVQDLGIEADRVAALRRKVYGP